MDVVYTEYYNENSYRFYPFADNTIAIDDNKVELADDVIIDAMIYTLRTNSAPYLAEINLVTNKLIIKDSELDTIIATGNITTSDTVKLVDEYGRSAGVIILGTGRSSLTSGDILRFTTNKLMFTTSCWYAPVQHTVQGFLLDDGTLIAGDVTFEGRGGMEVYSYYLSTAFFTGRNILRFSAKGAIKQIDGNGVDCDGIPIKALRLITTQGSKLIGTDYASGVMGINTVGFDQEDICPAKQIADPELIPPTYDPSPVDPTSPRPPPPRKPDICDPPVPPLPPPIPPDPGVIVSDVTVVPFNGRLAVVTPSTLATSNPLRLQTIDVPAKPVGLKPPDRPISIPKFFGGELKFAKPHSTLLLKVKGLGRVSK